MKQHATAILEDHHRRQGVDAAHAVDATDQGLRAHFHRLRVLGGTIVVAAVIATIMIVLCGDGVTIETFPAKEKSDDDIKKLVDDYNSVSGSIGSFISKPVEIFLGLLVSAAFLCFATDFTLDKSSIGHWQYIPLLTAAAIAYLFSNGLNALNVQVVPGTLRPIISTSDLKAPGGIENQPVLENGSLSWMWTRSSVENAQHNSVFNSVLRSKIIPTQNVPSVCTGTGYNDVIEPLVATSVVAFGFASRDWHMEVLLEAATPVKSLKINMSTPASALPSDSALPSSPSVTRGLVNMGVQVLSDLRLSSDLSTVPAVSTTGSAVSAAHAAWFTMFNRTTNASAKDATVEYSRFQLSEKVTYDAVTIELPVALVQRDKYNLVKSKVDGFNEMYVEDYCSRDGCIIPPPTVNRYGKATTIQSRVQATSICLRDDGTENEAFSRSPCARTSTSSMRIASIGTRVEGDVWDMRERQDGKVMRFRNLRTVYSITIGRLAWATEDLAQVFGTGCDSTSDDGGCVGVRHKLRQDERDDESDYLLVGQTHLPIKELDQYTATGNSKWVYLVTGADALGEQRYDVLRPRNFVNITKNGGSLETTPANKCNTFTDDYIRAVEKNHLYMEHSLQASYTAAFFYLFQNAAVVRRQLPPNSSPSGTGPSVSKSTASTRALEFDGNVQLMNVQVSVPTTNAIVSLVGCGVLLIVGVGVVIRAKRSEQQLRARASAEVVTEAMMNSSKYPPWLLDMALERATNPHYSPPNQPLQEESVRFVLQDLRVQGVVLQHHDEPRHAFHVGAEQRHEGEHV